MSVTEGGEADYTELTGQTQQQHSAASADGIFADYFGLIISVTITGIGHGGQ